MTLTKSQIEKIAIAIASAIIQELQNSNKYKVGGFLPLAALIPIIAAVLGGVGTVAGTVASRVQQSQADKETARHNRVLEEQSKKTGTGRLKKQGGFLPLEAILGRNHPIIQDQLNHTKTVTARSKGKGLRL